jgi:hypothetical protein
VYGTQVTSGGGKNQWSLPKARGTQTVNFRLSLNGVPLIYIAHFMLFQLQQKIIIFLNRLELRDSLYDNVGYCTYGDTELVTQSNSVEGL